MKKIIARFKKFVSSLSRETKIERSVRVHDKNYIVNNFTAVLGA